MATEGLPAERLRAFLRDLNPEARSLLVAELERSVLRGTEIPGASLILAELRPTLREARSRPERVGNPSRLFFRPLEPFIVEPGAARVLAGRIERSSLSLIWDWIADSLLPAAAKAYADTVVAALLRADMAAAAQATRAFQEEVAAAIDTALDRAAFNERFARRLAAQIRTERALEEAAILRDVLVHAPLLERIAGRLPLHMRSFSDEQVDGVLVLLKQNLAGHAAALRPALIIVSQRLDLFYLLIRLAVRSAESDAAAKVAQSPFALAVDMVLAEIRGAIQELRGLCRRGLFVEAHAPLKEVHDAVRAVRTEIELSPDSAWGRELAAIRAAVSDLLSAEIESACSRVRRLLRPRSGREIEPELDPDEVAEVEGRIALVAACRQYAGELAVNQLAPRVHSELQAYLDGAVSTLIESLRHAQGADLRVRQSQVSAAVRFAAQLFGAEYASLLTKAAAMAVAEHKAPA